MRAKIRSRRLEKNSTLNDWTQERVKSRYLKSTRLPGIILKLGDSHQPVIDVIRSNQVFRNAVKRFLRQIAPARLLAFYRQLARPAITRRLIADLPPSARQLYLKSLDRSPEAFPLAPEHELIRGSVVNGAQTLYGERWNYYSDALQPEIVQGFIRSIDACSGRSRLNYLEIGSCQGISMTLMGLLLRERGMLGSLVSVDPYFDSGYFEGKRSPHGDEHHVQVDKGTKALAQSLYGMFSLPVTLHERTSLEGLAHLISEGSRFDLIYIDGYHEQLSPMVDFGLACALLSPGGVVILDDHQWPDVFIVKHACDIHAERIQETWKTASYKVSFGKS